MNFLLCKGLLGIKFTWTKHKVRQHVHEEYIFQKKKFTVRKRSCGKAMFLHLSVSHSVHGGGGVCLPSACWDTHPRAGQTSPGGQCSGRYASYWNAFLLFLKSSLFTRKTFTCTFLQFGCHNLSQGSTMWGCQRSSTKSSTCQNI